MRNGQRGSKGLRKAIGQAEGLDQGQWNQFFRSVLFFFFFCFRGHDAPQSKGVKRCRLDRIRKLQTQEFDGLQVAGVFGGCIDLKSVG